MNKYGYVYITFNKINGKIYIGRHKGNYNNKYYGSGKYFLNSIKKYGKENFENYIIEWCENNDHLNEREIYWIKKYGLPNIEIGYNIAIGGKSKNNFKGLKKDEYNKFREKLSKSQKVRLSNKENHYYYGKKMSNSHRKNISEGVKKSMTIEVRKRMGDSQWLKGKKMPDHMIEDLKIRNKGKDNPMYGRSFWREISEEERAERSKKISKETSGGKNPRAKKGILFMPGFEENEKEFDCLLSCRKYIQEKYHFYIPTKQKTFRKNHLKKFDNCYFKFTI